jgi:VanZ family protein
MGQIRILAAIALFRVDAGTQGVRFITKSNGELVEDVALYYDEGMTHRFSRPIAWLLLLFIVFATVSPIGDRPHDFLPVQVDRALAFAMMTAFFLIAYPTRLLLVSVLCLASAFGIEALQFLSPTRDPHLSDASVKAIGALIGIGLGLVANACRKWIRRYPP